MGWDSSLIRKANEGSLPGNAPGYEIPRRSRTRQVAPCSLGMCCGEKSLPLSRLRDRLLICPLLLPARCGENVFAAPNCAADNDSGGTSAPSALDPPTPSSFGSRLTGYKRNAGWREPSGEVDYNPNHRGCQSPLRPYARLFKVAGAAKKAIAHPLASPVAPALVAR